MNYRHFYTMGVTILTGKDTVVYLFLGQYQPSLVLRRCETLWSAREIASMAPSAEQAGHTENMFHIALTACSKISACDAWLRPECQRRKKKFVLRSSLNTIANRLAT